jgi:spermidine/putrescine transport system permease protein
MVFLVAAMVVPLGFFFLYSLWAVRDFEIVPHWNLGNYWEAISRESYRLVLLNTLRIAASASVVTVLVAYGLAHAMRFHFRRWQSPLFFACIVALFSGYLVRIFAWRTILGDKGLVNSLLMRLDIVQEPLTFLLYNRLAATVVLCNFLVPLALLPIYSSLQNIGDTEIEAARDLGCTAFGALRRVVLPLAWPGIFAAFALSFIVASGDYVTPFLVGGVSGTMIGISISDSFLNAFNWPRGAALCFLTLACTLAVVAVFRWTTARIVK